MLELTVILKRFHVALVLTTVRGRIYGCATKVARAKLANRPLTGDDQHRVQC